MPDFPSYGEKTEERSVGGQIGGVAGDFAKWKTYAAKLLQEEANAKQNDFRMEAAEDLDKTPEVYKLDRASYSKLLDERSANIKAAELQRIEDGKTVLYEWTRKGGGTLTEGDIVLDPEQQAALKRGAPWMLNDEQAQRIMAKETPIDKLAPAVAGEQLDQDQIKRYRELVDEVRYGMHEKPKGWIPNILELLGAGGFAMHGAAEGLLADIRKKYGGEEVDQLKPGRKLLQEHRDVASEYANEEGGALADVLRSAFERKIPATETTPAMVEEVGPRAVYGAVPLTTIARGVANSPVESAKAAYEGAKAALWDPGRRNAMAAQALAAQDEIYLRAATKQANDELRGTGATKEQWLKRVYEIRDRFKTSDLSPQTPEGRQLLQESVLDPFNVVPSAHPLSLAGKGAKLGYKGARAAVRAAVGAAREASTASPFAAWVAETADKLNKMRGATEWYPEANDIRNATKLKDAEDLARGMELARDKAAIFSERKMAELDKAIAPLRKLKSTKTGAPSAEKIAVYDAASGDLDKLNPEMQQAVTTGGLAPQVEAAKEAQKIHAELREAGNLGQRYDENGVLLEAKWRQDYIPAVERDPLSTPPKRPGVMDKTALAKWRAAEKTQASAYERAPYTSESVPLKDPLKQWDSEINRMSISAPHAVESRELEPLLREHGAVLHLEGGHAYESAAAIEKADARMAELDLQLVGGRKIKARALSDGTEIPEKVSRGLVEQMQAAQETLRAINEEIASLKTGAKTAISPEGQGLGDMAKLAARRDVWTKKARKLESAVAKKNEEFIQLRDTRDQRTAAFTFDSTREKEIDTRIADLTEKTGVPWVSLDEDAGFPAGEIYRQRVMPPGTTRKMTTIMPKPIADRVRALSILEPKATSPSIAAANQFMDSLVRPVQRFWRTAHTLGGIIPFAITNATGAPAFGYMAHGLRSLSPEHQALSIGATLMSGGLNAIENVPFRLKNADTTIGELVRLADKIGVVNISDFRLGLGGGQSKTLLGKGVDVVEKAAYQFGNVPYLRGVSPQNITRMIDNYQHFVVFLGFLEDYSPKAIRKAYALTNEFAGNYRHLAPLERAVLHDTFGFYSWYRFILPYTVKQTFQHPERLAQMYRNREFIQNRYGFQLPVFQEGRPATMSTLGLPPHPETVGGEFEELNQDDHLRAISMMEDTINMGYSIVPYLFGKGDDPTYAKSSFMGPFVNFAVEWITQRDKDGNPIPEFIPTPIPGESSLGRAGRMAASGAGRLALSMVERPSRAANNIIKLYSDADRQVGALDFRMRLKAGNDFAGLDNLAIAAGRAIGVTKKRGRSLGGMFNPDLGVSLIPRLQHTYAFDPYAINATNSRDTEEEASAYQRLLERGRRQ